MSQCCVTCWKGLRSAGNAVFSVKAYVEGLKSGVGTLRGPGIKGIHGQATGILIHKALLLTTFSTLSEGSHAFDGEVAFRHDESIIRRKLRPDRFFVANYELDMALVCCEEVSSDISPLSMDTRKATGGSYAKGHTVYLVGHPRNENHDQQVQVGVGKVAVGPDQQVIRFAAENNVAWVPGSAGFDSWGNFAFITCHPHEWLPNNSKVKKKRFSLMPVSRSKLKQSGLTIHTIKKWMETTLMTGSQGEKEAQAFSASPQISKADLQPLQELVASHGSAAALKKPVTDRGKEVMTSGPEARSASRPASRPGSRPASRPTSPARKEFVSEELQSPRSPDRQAPSSPAKIISISLNGIGPKTGEDGVQIRDPVTMIIRSPDATGSRPGTANNAKGTTQPSSEKAQRRELIKQYRKKEQKVVQKPPPKPRPQPAKRRPKVQQSTARKQQSPPSEQGKLPIEEEAPVNEQQNSTNGNVSSDSRPATTDSRSVPVDSRPTTSSRSTTGFRSTGKTGKAVVKKKKSPEDAKSTTPRKKQKIKGISADNRLLQHTSASKRRVSVSRGEA